MGLRWAGVVYSILFGEALVEGGNVMKLVVSEYEGVSGQFVNYDKSLKYFNGNVDHGIRKSLGVRISNNPKRYLGMPTMVGRRKIYAFVDLKEKFMRKMISWSVSVHKVNFASYSDLYNAMFYVACFFVSGVIQRLERVYIGASGAVCTLLKRKEGLGFKDLNKFNMALLAKYGWKLLTQPNFLFARVIKAKYFPRGDFMSACLEFYPSYTWKSI
ncbi:reverse transcriptase [Gossypium australe]|uniref:Reverse transcriptase n=1 Tax=Gossypium australe TaxID=47621 RepID=A0A5B6VV67_9ROSI|nr:reverse transcriptase [Gossypium australe]